jgi:hypothetical protein
MLDTDSRLDPAVERRASKRFPIEQEVSYRVLDHKAIVPESGVGRTFDISSGGILFATEQRLRSGKRIELSVNWPAVLDGGCLLKVVAVGRIVRVEDARASIIIEQYEFRTRRSKDAAAVTCDKTSRSVVQYS